MSRVGALHGPDTTRFACLSNVSPLPAGDGRPMNGPSDRRQIAFGIQASPAQLVWATLLLGAAVRLAVAAVLGLGVDESYTVANARSLQWSYYDHPPLSFWIVHATVWLTGSEANPVVRLPFIALFALTGWLLYRLGSVLFSPWAGAWAAVLANLAPIYTIAFGGWILPDGPLLAAMLASALCLVGLLQAGKDCRPARRWALALGAGLFLGLACLAKYHGFLFGAGIALFLATSPRHRHWLVRPETWAAGLVALAVFSPVLIWNAQNDWISIAFQAGRAAAREDPKPQQALVAVLGQILYLGPWIWLPLVWAVARSVRAGPRDEGAWFLFWAGLLPILIFTLTPLWGSRGLPHWQAPGYIFWLPLLGRAMTAWWPAPPATGRRGARWWLGLAAAALLLAVPVLASHAATGWAGRAFPALFAKGDPTHEGLDWTDLHDWLAARGDLDQPDLFVGVWHWIDAGKVDAALGDRLPVAVLTADPRNFAFQHDLSAFAGRDAILVGRERTERGWVDRYRPHFREIEPLGEICVSRAGHCEVPLKAYLGRGYKGDFPLPFGPSAATGSR